MPIWPWNLSRLKNITSWCCQPAGVAYPSDQQNVNFSLPVYLLCVQLTNWGCKKVSKNIDRLSRLIMMLPNVIASILMHTNWLTLYKAIFVPSNLPSNLASSWLTNRQNWTNGSGCISILIGFVACLEISYFPKFCPSYLEWLTYFH